MATATVVAPVATVVVAAPIIPMPVVTTTMVATPVVVAPTMTAVPTPIVMAIVVPPVLVVALKVAIVMAPLGALVVLPAVRVTIAMVVAVAAMHGNDMTPMRMAHVMAIVVDGVTNGRTDDECQRVVLGMRESREWTSEARDEHAGAEQGDGCSDHVLLLVIRPSLPGTSHPTQVALNAF